MRYRIYNTPFTRINEHWNLSDMFNSSPSESYANSLINTKSKSHHDNINDIQMPLYDKIAFDIVAETVYNYPHPQITEKTIRPIVSKRMFIIVGAPFTLQMLHNKGFKTFSPFINESYDLCTDPHLRMSMILDEITRLCNLPLKEIKESLIKYEDTLNHNSVVYNNLLNLETDDLKRVLDTI